MHDPHEVAWKMKSKEKLIGKTVGNFPKELSRTAWFFIEQGGKISGNPFKEKEPFPILKGEIMLEVELKIGDKKKKNL